MSSINSADITLAEIEVAEHLEHIHGDLLLMILAISPSVSFKHLTCECFLHVPHLVESVVGVTGPSQFIQMTVNRKKNKINGINKDTILRTYAVRRGD